MIIKGKSRAGPSQLARHLGRADTNERVEILQLDSAGTPAEAFRDWQTYTLATNGRLGLYHANVDPDAKYDMTPQQWMRAVEILEEELGLQGQPRAVVMHEKNGRAHIHVVWARADMDSMTLRSDSMNYQAHERASLRMEQEFGHEHVPGKHAKRDREAQPEMPSAEATHDEWQQRERGGIDHRARKVQVTALFEASDSGLAFKAALEDAGYVLAQGDRRDFVILDADAKVHSLGRQLPGVKAKALREFMADIDAEGLPTVAEARATIRSSPKEQEALVAPEPSAPTPEEDTRLGKMLAALAERHAEQWKEQANRFRAERAALEQAQLVEETNRLEEITKEAIARQMQERPPEPGAVERLWRTVREAVSEEARAERLAEERRRSVEFDDRVNDDIRAQAAGLRFKQKSDWERLDERQAQERADLEAAQAQDRARRIADEQRAIALEREYEQRRKDAFARERDGPERDSRTR